MSDASRLGNACPLCACTGSEHAVFEEIMAYVADNAHRVHLNELVKHVRAALSERLQISMGADQVRTHFLAHHLPTSLSARKMHRSICNATKLALSLCPLFPHGSEERAIMRQFVHFLPQLLHAAGLRHQDVEYCCAIFVQGKWR
jgi:hypothetical protein